MIQIMIHNMSTEQKPQIPNIVFECGDFENDIDMLLIEKGDFHFYLHNSFTGFNGYESRYS
jgi:hypothetical protein